MDGMAAVWLTRLLDPSPSNQPLGQVVRVRQSQSQGRVVHVRQNRFLGQVNR